MFGPYQRSAIVVLREPASALSALVHDRRSLIIKQVIGVRDDRAHVEEGPAYVNDVAIGQGLNTATSTVGAQPIDIPEAIVLDGAAEVLILGFNDARARAPTALRP